jgi:hypothetical protein
MNSRVQSLCGAAALLALAHAAVVLASARTSAAPAEVKVSTRAVGMPLAELTAQLSTPDVRLTAAPALREMKASIAVREQPLSEVMAALARVFGAEWREVKAKAGAHYELRRRADVFAWLREWKSAYREGERAARKFQEETFRGFFERGLAAADGPFKLSARGSLILPEGLGDPPLARLVRSLTPEQKDLLVRHVAAISAVRQGGAPAQVPAPLVFRFSDLSPQQQELLRGWVTRSKRVTPLTPLDTRRVAELPNTLVEIGSRNGITAEVTLYPPPPDHPYGSSAAGASASSMKLEQILREAQFRHLARKKTPAHALLGAAITGDGSVVPAVSMADPDLPRRLIPPAALPERAQGSEFLMSVAQECGLEYVADYHTWPARLPRPQEATAAGKLLEAASKQFEKVIRQEGRYLLARNPYWPDRDEEEVPAPWPERWIAAKREERALGLEDLLVMSRLSEAQLACLRRYIEDRRLSFSREVEAVQRYRWIWPLMESITPSQRRKAESKQGLPVRELGLRHRAFLLNSTQINAPWESVRIHVEKQQSLLNKSEHHFRLLLRVPGRDAPIWGSE